MLQQQPASSFDAVGRWGREDGGGGGGQSRQWNESPKTVEELGKGGLGRIWVTVGVGWGGIFHYLNCPCGRPSAGLAWC